MFHLQLLPNISSSPHVPISLPSPLSLHSLSNYTNTTGFDIISCAAAIVRAGAIPVVVDCGSTTWNIDIQQLEAKITPQTILPYLILN